MPLVWNLIRTWRKGEPAGNNPWDAPTLEWTMSSPPPHYNFAIVPEVDRRDPLWHPYIEEGLGWAGEVEPGGVFPREQPVEAPEPVIMPNPSYWPLVLAIGLLIVTIGGLGSLGLTLFGAAVTLVGLFGWAFEPAFPEEGH